MSVCCSLFDVSHRLFDVCTLIHDINTQQLSRTFSFFVAGMGGGIGGVYVERAVFVGITMFEAAVTDHVCMYCIWNCNVIGRRSTRPGSCIIKTVCRRQVS